MTLFFVSNPESPFYQSQAFGKVIDYMMKYTRRCDLREQNGRRSMLIKDIPNVETAVGVLQEIVALPLDKELSVVFSCMISRIFILTPSGRHFGRGVPH